MPLIRLSLGAAEIQWATPHLHPSLLDKASKEAKLTKAAGFCYSSQNTEVKKHIKNSATQYQGINSQREQDSRTTTVLILIVFSTCTYICMHINICNSHPLSQPWNTKLNIRACSVGHFMVTCKLKFLCLPVSRWYLYILTIQNWSVLLNLVKWHRMYVSCIITN